MSGCIPVVIKYEWQEKEEEEGTDDTTNTTTTTTTTATQKSYFAPRTVKVQDMLPFAKGTFPHQPNFGIDYSELLLELDGHPDACGLPCIKDAVEDLVLHHPDKLRQKQRMIAKYSRIFSYGLQDQAFEGPDAVSALLVTVRMYIQSLELTN